MEYKVHAPPGRPPGAFCRFVAYALIADRPSQVTCQACLRKMTTQTAPWPKRRHRWRQRT